MAAATRFNGTTHSQKFTRKFVAFDKEVCKPVENQDAETMLWDPDRLPDLTVPQLQGFVEQHVVVLDTFKVAGLTNATSLRRNIGQYAVAYRSEFDRKTEQEIQQGQQRFRLEINHVELQGELAQLQIDHGRLGTENRNVITRLAEVERLLQEAVTTNTEDKSQSDTAITELKTKLKTKEDRITDLTEEVNNKQSQTEKIELKIYDKLMDNGEIEKAIHFLSARDDKNKQHHLTETKIRLIGEQCINTTGAIASNTRGDGDRMTNTLSEVYGQLNAGISATDTVPKEKYDTDIKEVNEQCSKSNRDRIAAEKENDVLKAKSNTLQLKQNGLVNDLMDGKLQCELLTADKRNLESDAKDATSRAAETKLQLAAMTADRRKSTENRRKSKEQAVAILEFQLSNLAEKHQAQVAQLRAECSNLAANHQEQVAELRAECEHKVAQYQAVLNYDDFEDADEENAEK